MRKPMIGVLPLIDYEKESYWMLPGYMEGIEQAGGLPVILPSTSNRADIEQIAGSMDGFLFTGGHDVSPSLYGEEKRFDSVDLSRDRDDMEIPLLKLVQQIDKPALGICRGIQLLNATMGGTLYQDIPSEYDTRIEHHQEPPYDVPAHKVSIVDGTPLHDLLGVDELAVNSYHHQAVKDLAPELEAMAISEDGLIEAVCDPSCTFVWGLQWHPEFSYKTDGSSRKIFSAFVEAAASVAASRGMR